MATARFTASTACLSADPEELSRRLVGAVRASRQGDPLRPTAVVAPTSRALDHLSVQLARSAGALANVHLVHHRGLAERILAAAGQAPGRELPDWIHRALLQRLLDPGRSRLERHLDAQPASLPAMLSTLRDLRDAGIGGGPVPAAVTAAGRETLEFYARYCELWSTLEARGYGDAASLAQRAERAVRTLQNPPFAELHHYGAYDLVGVQRRLLTTLAERTPICWWIPGPAEGPASALPRRLCQRLELRPQEVPAEVRGELSECSAPDPRLELTLALRVILAWAAESGIPLSEMAILARHSGPYLPHLRSVWSRTGLDPDRVAPLGPARDAASSRWRAALHVLQLPALPDAARRRRAQRAGLRWTRAELSRHLQRWRHGALGQRLALLQELAEDLGAETWAAPLADLRDSAEQLADLLPDGDALAFRPEELSPSAPTPEAGGPRFLDLAQARGLSWRRALLLGCNEDLFPRRAVEDPFLQDADRRVLREHDGEDLGEKGSDCGEEELLLALLRHSVSERLELSFFRADDSGRSAAASPYLLRLRGAMRSAPASLPHHPGHAWRSLLEKTGMLRREEALALAGMDSAQPIAAVRRLAGTLDGDRDGLLRALERLEEVDSFETRDPRFDGDFGPPPPHRPLTASSLSQLGRCPLRFAFRYVLGIPEPNEDADALEPPGRTVGSLVHAVLEDLYARLFATPEAGVDSGTLWQRARRLLPAIWQRREQEYLGESVLPRSLRELRAPAWRTEVEQFVQRDLARRVERGLLRQQLELTDEPALSVGERAVPVRVRLDRVLRDASDREWIGDYKWKSATGLKNQARLVDALRGRELQLVVYWLARRARNREVAGLELIALRADRDRFAAQPAAPWREVDLASFARWEGELHRTLDTLLSVTDRGRYPLVSDSSQEGHGLRQCGSCAYRRACRHTHPPTLDRVERHPEHLAYFSLAHKEVPRARRSGAGEGQ